MLLRSPATFTHADWIRAISAHLPGAVHVKVPTSGLPRLQATLRAKTWPVAWYDTWETPLNNAGLPAAGPAPSATDALALIESTQAPILFRNLPADHPVTRALLGAASQTRILKTWERAALHLNGSFDDWMQNNFDQKRRKELKRLRARLSEQGKLETLRLAPGEDIQPFFQAFLKLEAEGWKGKRGTAIASDLKAKNALAAGLSAMAKAGRLLFWQIRFNDEPIASLFALVDDGEVALGKIAYAESFAKYSPGLLVIIDATQDLLDAGTYVRADSNAIPGHPMIDRVWRDRIACMDVLMAGPTVSTPAFRLLAAWLGTKDAAKQTIKRVLAQTTGRKLS